MKRHPFFIFSVFLISFVFTGCVGTLVTETAMNREILPEIREDVRDYFVEDNISKVPEELKSAVEEHTENWIETLPDAEEWELLSYDGLKLCADFYPDEDSHLYLICVHGFLCDNSYVLNTAAVFSDFADWNFLLPDCRAHGESEGKYYGMGYQDSFDLLGWINKITDYDPYAQIVLAGRSMGGATVLMVSGLDIPDNVKCIIADCAYSSMVDELSFLIDSNFHLPPDPIVEILESSFEFVTGYEMEDVSPEKALEKCKVPVLFIHGSEDDIVGPEMMNQNEEAVINGIYEDLIVTGAGHETSIYFDPVLYSSTIKTFVEKYVDLKY